MPELHGSGNANQSATKKRQNYKECTHPVKQHKGYLTIKFKFTLKSWAISRTSLWNGNFLIKSSVLFWYLRISLHYTIIKESETKSNPNCCCRKPKLTKINITQEYSPKSNSTRSVSVGFLHSTSSGS